LQAIKAGGAKAGIVLNPGTHPDVVDPVIDELDLILVMSVNPGFGGQSFIPSQLEKIKTLAAKIKASGRDIILEVDGGVNPITSQQCIEAGATALVGHVAAHPAISASNRRRTIPISPLGGRYGRHGSDC